MGWRIVALNEASLGSRALRNGSKGKDVRELQQLLSTAGFYFGLIDGVYGILTEEAVSLFQKTFGLKNDGVAGPRLITALKAVSYKDSRIIYNVKPKESLKNISRKFGVAVSAWQGIPGQGNPQRNIYPGMKLLLNQKAILCSGKRAESFRATAYLEAGWKLMGNGEIIRLNPNSAESFQTITADPGIWKEFLSSSQNWGKVTDALKLEPARYWGIDFRNAPLETVFRWKDFLRYLCKKLQIEKIPFLAISVPGDAKSLQNKIFWLDLPQLSESAKLLLIEPLSNLDSPLMYLKSSIHLVRTLHRFTNDNLGSKTLLMGWAGGWNWNLDQKNQCRRVSYREGRLLAAMHQRSSVYKPDTTLTIVDYIHLGERHCLIFRDQQGWRDWVKIGLKFNLLGFAIHDSKDLGRFGNEITAGAFGILPYDKL